MILPKGHPDSIGEIAKSNPEVLNANELRIVVRAKEEAERALEAHRPEIFAALNGVAAQSVLSAGVQLVAFQAQMRPIFDSLISKFALLDSVQTAKLATDRLYESPDYGWLARSYVSPETRSARLEAKIEVLQGTVNDLQDELSEVREIVERGDPETRRHVAQIDLRVARLSESVYHDNESQDEEPDGDPV